MQTDLEKRPQRARAAGPLAAAGHGDQGAEPVQHPQRLAVVRHRQTVTEPCDDVRQRRRAPVQHAEQVHERRVLTQPVSEGQPPRLGREVALEGGPEEELVLRADVCLGRRVPRRVHAGRQLVDRMQVAG